MSLRYVMVICLTHKDGVRGRGEWQIGRKEVGRRGGGGGGAKRPGEGGFEGVQNLLFRAFRIHKLTI